MRYVLQGTVLALVSAATWLSPEDAFANPRVRVGVSFGGGGFRIGVGNAPFYGPGYYGPGWGPRYGYGYGYDYGPPPVVVQPYPVYQPQPVYVQPQPQPQYVPQSTAPPEPSSLPDGGEILIFSPSTNAGDVRYTLNGHPYSMPPGTKQKFTNDRTWTVEFETAPGLPPTRYTLSAGRYKFKPSNAGLALYQTQDLPEAQPQTVPPAPVPSLPEPSLPGSDGDIVPPRPALKTTP